MKTKTTKPKPKTYTVVCVRWLESEAGWGQKPDGYSLHRTVEDARKYIDNYWDEQPKLPKGTVPSYYFRPDGDPFPVTAKLSTYKKIKGNGILCDGDWPRIGSIL